MSERTAVYRFYDADDVLIYVGVTRNTVQRWWRHSHTQTWWHQVARAEVTWLDSRPDALLAERRAVLTVLRESLTPVPEAEADQRQRWAVVFASRVGWSKYQIADELGVAPPVVTSILMAFHRDGGNRLTASFRLAAPVKGPTVDSIIKTAEREDSRGTGRRDPG